MARSVSRKPATSRRKTGLKNIRKTARSKRAAVEDAIGASSQREAFQQAMSVEESLAKTVSDIEKLVRGHPLPALGAAATFGLLIGILMGRSR